MNINSLLLGVLESALARLLSRLADVDWNAVIQEVQGVWNADWPGEQKRRWVYGRLREMSARGASWLLYAAIEIAVGTLKTAEGKS